MIGGPGVAYNIGNDRSRFPTSQRPNGGDMMVGAAETGTPVDFFTFHDVNPCLDAPVCNVTDVSSFLIIHLSLIFTAKIELGPFSALLSQSIGQSL